MVEPGEAAYPYHFHYGDEEMLIVLEGAPSLRTPGGWRELSEGEVVAFPAGEASAHQLVNRTGKAVRFLALSTVGDVDLVVYPDSRKVMTNYRRNHPEQFRAMFKQGDAVDYWEGEAPPA
ncbi:MAG: cupin domain-containing protein [Solirubrobacterales bacterium]